MIQPTMPSGRHAHLRPIPAWPRYGGATLAIAIVVSSTENMSGPPVNQHRR